MFRRNTLCVEKLGGGFERSVGTFCATATATKIFENAQFDFAVQECDATNAI